MEGLRNIVVPKVGSTLHAFGCWLGSLGKSCCGACLGYGANDISNLVSAITPLAGFLSVLHPSKMAYWRPRNTKRQHPPQASPGSSFKQILNRPQYFPIADRIWNLLGIQDLINLSRTCRELHSQFLQAAPSIWDINKHLLRFVSDPVGFRSLLGECNALVSGSDALRFWTVSTGLGATSMSTSKGVERIRIVDNPICMMWWRWQIGSRTMVIASCRYHRWERLFRILSSRFASRC